MNLLSRAIAIGAGFPCLRVGAFLPGHCTSMVPALTYIKRLYRADSLRFFTWVPRPPKSRPASEATSPLSLTTGALGNSAGVGAQNRAWTQEMNGKFGELAFINFGALT